MLKRQMVIILLSFLFFSSAIPQSVGAETLHIPPEKSREELYQDIFISMLMPVIREEINKYYEKTLTRNPMLYPYMIFVENAERVGEYRSYEFLLTVKVYPVVGPHIEVGQDRLKIHVTGTGDITVKEFDHIKDYDLPDNWKHIKKQS